MKERIYSIPLTDALNEGCDCVMCALEEKLEHDAVDYFMGASKMEPDVRIMTNKKGFCRRHLHMMDDAGSPLGLALMLDTHLNEIVDRLGKRGKVGGLFAAKKNLGAVAGELESIIGGCVVCDKLTAHMNDAAGNLVYLWDKEPDFRRKLEASKGLCLPHMLLVLKAAGSELNGKRLDEFADFIVNTQMEMLETLNEDVDWFTKKFDFNHKDDDWKNSKDAVPRAVNKLVKFE